VARTDIDLDDALVAEVMRRYDVHTEKDAVDLALRRLVRPVMSPTADARDARLGLGRRPRRAALGRRRAAVILVDTSAWTPPPASRC
jgi:Arc/MetJ family transcription regulator